jgi:hypothetical protein
MSTGVRSGANEAVVEASFEVAVEHDDAIVEERTNLREQRAGDLLHRIQPEVAVEESCPGAAAGAAAMRARTFIDVERIAPFLRVAGKLIDPLTADP